MPIAATVITGMLVAGAADTVADSATIIRGGSAADKSARCDGYYATGTARSRRDTAGLARIRCLSAVFPSDTLAITAERLSEWLLLREWRSRLLRR